MPTKSNRYFTYRANLLIKIFLRLRTFKIRFLPSLFYQLKLLEPSSLTNQAPGTIPVYPCRSYTYFQFSQMDFQLDPGGFNYFSGIMDRNFTLGAQVIMADHYLPDFWKKI